MQGVGFRPTVWRLARSNDLVGEVFNDAEGVLIRISGEQGNIHRFLDSLPSEVPPLARIEAMEIAAGDCQWQYHDFRIAHSGSGRVRTQVSVDAATCEACREEIFDVSDRRYLYPFSNCTHCGPRLTIVEGIPYDRGHTTMADFPLCGQCREEYENPADRRFHAQPIACHACGPKVIIEEVGEGGNPLLDDTMPEYPVFTGLSQAQDYNSACLARIAAALGDGKIVALRGLGGFHLCCDATNDEAVARLRQRKHRYAKPFALMARDLDAIARYGEISPVEAEQLRSESAPIVLLREKPAPVTAALSPHVAPGSGLLGFMLPYTPLHHLVTRHCEFPLVMTSGNRSDEPQVIDNREARRKLSPIADLIVYHNRDIANRIDDSVVRCMGGRPRLMRRARGYAPAAIAMPPGFENSPDVLAFGAELKSTFCLLQDGKAIVSQHQGDLEDVATFEDYEKNLALYRELYQHRPRLLAADLHPEYLSSKLARQTLENAGGDGALGLTEVQHHHAHIASCLVENGVSLEHPPVLGIALDGLGYGTDGTIWGGEFMLADYREYRHLGRLRPVPMIGGVQAILEPWRNTYAHILSGPGWETYTARFAGSALHRYFLDKPLDTINRMLDAGLNVPLTSSCGRLFDAVAAALDLSRDRAQFEGQGAIALEMLVPEDFSQRTDISAYPFQVNQLEASGATDNAPAFTLDPGNIWLPLLADLEAGVDRALVAGRFHRGLIDALLATVGAIAGQHAFTAVALSGGCLQNRVLLEGLQDGIQAAGFDCYTQGRVPANDGGISLGQAAVAAARALQGTTGIY